MNLKHWCKRKCFSLYMKIVREKASPEYIARGWAIGWFFGCLIPFGFQLICSIPAAFILKGSKIGATLGTLLTNQVTIFFIYPVQCYVGSRIMGSDLTYSAIKVPCRNVLRRRTMIRCRPRLGFARGFLHRRAVVDGPHDAGYLLCSEDHGDPLPRSSGKAEDKAIAEIKRKAGTYQTINTGGVSEGAWKEDVNRTELRHRPE